MTHRKVVCRVHGTVYSNCRCMSPNKVTEPIDCHCTEEQKKMTNPGHITAPGAIPDEHTALSFYAVFVRVHQIWRYEGMFFGPDSSPARERIKRTVEQENGPGTYYETRLPE